MLFYHFTELFMLVSWLTFRNGIKLPLVTTIGALLTSFEYLFIARYRNSSGKLSHKWDQHLDVRKLMDKFLKLKKAPPEAETSGGAVIFRRIYQFIIQLTCEILHSTSTTVVSRVVPSLLFSTLMVTVHVPVQLVSTVIASPTFHAVVSSVSVDDQQLTRLFVVTCWDGAGCSSIYASLDGD